MKNGLAFSILFVDDDEDDREIINEAFQEIGYEAEIKKFVEPKALLRYLDQIEPSAFPLLIVLDNTLPGLDAVDVLSTLKNSERYKEIPVLIYSGSVSKFKQEKLLEMGVLEVIEKGTTMKNAVEIARHLKDLVSKRAGKER